MLLPDREMSTVHSDNVLILWSMNTRVTSSDEARALAEKRARELGFRSIDEYVDALIHDDQEKPVFEEWMRAKIEEGLASGPAHRFRRSPMARVWRFCAFEIGISKQSVVARREQPH